MSLSLITRAGNGAPLTANQFDSNMNGIAAAVNTNTTAITGKTSDATVATFFEGVSSAKYQVDWARLTNKPAEIAQRYCFNAYMSASDQVYSGGSGTVNINFDSTTFNLGSAFDTTNHWFLAPVAGYYQINASTQVQLVSGSPTAVSILSYVKINGTHVMISTLDNTGTGTRIYRASSLQKINAGDTINMSVDFTWTGSASWSISGAGNPNTSLSGFLVMPQ